MSYHADRISKPHPDVTCPACGSGDVRHVWSDHLHETPVIFECGNARCHRPEFGVLRLNGRIVHCGTPGKFRPRSTGHSAVKHANRARAMENLPPALTRTIWDGPLRGVEDV